MLINKKELNDCIQILVDYYNPLKIILFGSSISGNINANSDFDFCVILDNNQDKKQAKPILPRKCSLVIDTLDDFNSLKLNFATIEFIIDFNGQTVYER